MDPKKVSEALLVFEDMLKEGIITKQDFEARKKEVMKLMKDQEVKDVENTIVSMRLRDKQEELSVLNKLYNTGSFPFVKEFLGLDKKPDDEELVNKFVRLLLSKEQFIPVAQYVIEYEIRVDHTLTLRGESLGVALLRSYWFHFEGTDFFKKVIKPMAKNVIEATKKKPLEIDPNRGALDSAKNLRLMQQLTNSFLLDIYSSESIFSKNFKSVLKFTYDKLNEVEGASKSHLGLGYSEEALRLFGAFLLLRFINPVIVTPTKYGIVKYLTPGAQRCLILISKVMQNIANQVDFDGAKEPYMVPLNEFVQDHMPRFLAFVASLLGEVTLAAEPTSSPLTRKVDEAKKPKPRARSWSLFRSSGSSTMTSSGDPV